MKGSTISEPFMHHRFILKIKLNVKAWTCTPQLFLPVGHVEAGSLKLGQVECGVDRARCDGTRGVRVVVGGRHRHDLHAVAVGGLEDSAGDVRPALHGARTGAAVDAIGGACPARGRRPRPRRA